MPEYDSTVEYRDVPGFPGYKVGNDGSVWTTRRIKTWRQMKPAVSGTRGGGYLAVGFSREGKQLLRYVHRIVLEVFVGPCPEGMEGCHKDGNRRNNSHSNLRWDTHAENIKDAIKHGRFLHGENQPNSRHSDETVREVRRLAEAGVRGKEISRRLKIPSQTVYGYLLGQRRTKPSEAWAHLR